MGKAKKKRRVRIEKLSEEELLRMRVKDLKLRIRGSAVEPMINQLYAELEAKGISFHPPCYLSDEWLCPDKVPMIGIPFFLAHPSLKKIEQKMMLDVEGGTEKQFMKLLRHECGHALNYAYELYNKTRWRELFGRFSITYSDSYDFQPYSRRFVVHLADYYAQSHPDDDFAETFAVWLSPDIDWQNKYKDWPVIKKLQYVDGLVKKIANKRPLKKAERNPPFSADRMRSTLSSYYERKRRTLGPEFQGYYDDSIKKIFSENKYGDSAIKASHLLRQYRRRIVDSVTGWTGHRKYDINQLLGKFILRCDNLGLYTVLSEPESLIAATALLTTIASNTFRAAVKGRR
jgi:hypothetical protein